MGCRYVLFSFRSMVFVCLCVCVCVELDFTRMHHHPTFRCCRLPFYDLDGDSYKFFLLYSSFKTAWIACTLFDIHHWWFHQVSEKCRRKCEKKIRAFIDFPFFLLELRVDQLFKDKGDQNGRKQRFCYPCKVHLSIERTRCCYELTLLCFALLLPVEGLIGQRHFCLHHP